jgi:RHS repeat-associated protein
LGTVTEVTDSSGELVERYGYDVYGEPQIWDGNSNLLSSSAIGNRLLFQGRDRDPDTGLYNFRNRYYTPAWGRFVQVDPVREMAGLSAYHFGKNNPINRVDPTGLFSWKPAVIQVILQMLDQLLQMALQPLFKNCQTCGDQAMCRACCYAAVVAGGAVVAALSVTAATSCTTVGPLLATLCLALTTVWAYNQAASIGVMGRQCLDSCR